MNSGERRGSFSEKLQVPFLAAGPSRGPDPPKLTRVKRLNRKPAVNSLLCRMCAKRDWLVRPPGARSRVARGGARHAAGRAAVLPKRKGPRPREGKRGCGDIEAIRMTDSSFYMHLVWGTRMCHSRRAPRSQMRAHVSGALHTGTRFRVDGPSLTSQSSLEREWSRVGPMTPPSPPQNSTLPGFPVL